MSVGIELIDKQYQMLIQRLNELSEAVEKAQGPKVIVKILGFLIEYADFHFSTEEKHMKAQSYPGLSNHKRAHESFAVPLTNLEGDFREEGATKLLAGSIDTFLMDWLVKHIKGVDLEFGAFLKEKGVELG